LSKQILSVIKAENYRKTNIIFCFYLIHYCLPSSSKGEWKALKLCLLSKRKSYHRKREKLLPW